MARDVGDLSVPLTAFGDTATSELVPTIQLGFPYGVVNAQQIATTLSGVGCTVTASNSLLTVTASGSNATASARSVRFHNYRPGQGCSARFTFKFSEPTAGATQLIGMGDSVDGLFFGYNGLDFGTLRRVNAVDNWTPQTQWNEDPFLGETPLWQVTGHPKPKVTSNLDVSHHPALDPQHGYPAQIQWQWLGFGQITFFVESIVTGRFHPVHRVAYAGENDFPTIYNPSLPFLMFCSTSTSGGSVSVATASVGVFNEGPTIPLGSRWSTQNLVTGVATEKAVLSIRNESTFAGETNRVPVRLDWLSGLNIQNTRGSIVRLYRNATVTSGSWVLVSTSNSVVSVNTTATATSNGQPLLTLFTAPNGVVNEDLSLQSIVAYPGETLSVTAENPGTAEVRAALSWLEES